MTNRKTNPSKNRELNPNGTIPEQKQQPIMISFTSTADSEEEKRNLRIRESIIKSVKAEYNEKLSGFLLVGFLIGIPVGWAINGGVALWSAIFGYLILTNLKKII